ncbi:MAG TPA: DUF222 domain-containing protein, partial [Pseudonocardia sp.]|nr:DUF222 domain-containing protein [Pseudonocardia sp.]
MALDGTTASQPNVNLHLSSGSMLIVGDGWRRTHIIDFFLVTGASRALKNVGPAWHNGGMSESSIASGDQAVFAALAQSRVASGSASGQELIDRLTFLKSVIRQAEHDMLHTVAQLDGRGEFTDRGIRTASAVADLLRCTSTESRRMVAVAASVFPTSLTGEPLEPRLPATATALDGWEIDRAHAEVIERALSG